MKIVKIDIQNMSTNNSQANNEEMDESNSELQEYPLLLDGTKYFRVKEEKDNGQIIAVCMSCEVNGSNAKKTSTQIEYRGSQSSKSNFTKHLQRIHSDLFKEYEQENPSKRRKISYNKFEIMNLEEKQNLSDEFIFNYLVNNFLPLYIINDDLKNIIHNLNSHINVTSVQQLQLKIGRSVMELKQNFITDFEQISFLSLAAVPIEIHETVHMLIACFWLDTIDFSRQHAVLSCRFVASNDLEASSLAITLDTMDEYGITKEQVTSVILNDAVLYDDDFMHFINDPTESPSSENYYAIPSSYPQTVRFPRIQSVQSDINDIKFENSVLYQIVKFGITDFMSLLNQHDKLALHYRVFAKVNRIWNAAIDKAELIESICKINIQGPTKNHIMSFYNAIRRIQKIADKLSTLAKKMDRLPTFLDSELIYLDEIINYLLLIKGAVETLEADQQGHYGNAAPILASLKQRLAELEFVELEEVHASIVEEFQYKFENYLDPNIQNTAMFAACFHPGYKRDWIPSTMKYSERQKIQDMCKEKVSEIVPKTATQRQAESSGEPRKSSFVILRPHDNLKETDNIRIETLTYFNEPLDGNDKLTKLPNIRKLFIQYNTTVCNPLIVQALIEHTNILKIINTKLPFPELVNSYSIINAAKWWQPEQEEEDNV